MKPLPIHRPTDPRTTMHRLRGRYRAWSSLLAAYLSLPLDESSALAWLLAYHGQLGVGIARMARVVDVTSWATECATCGGFACRRHGGAP